MTEYQPAGTEDTILGPAVSQDGKHASNGEPVAQSGTAAGPADVALEEDVESSGPEDSRADEYLALAQRTQADFENYRKRMTRELDGAQARGITRLAKELLPALDNLERALAAAQEATHVDEQLIEGLRLVQRELIAALERGGIERYGVAGEGFDPVLHEAVAHQPVEGAQAGAVVEVYQPGYRIAGAVIRPARVLVAA
jgi:molecular chaperone GrpE